MSHTHIERTLVIIKPDAVRRGLIGEIISRFERVGLTLIDMKTVQAEMDHVKGHYTLEPGWKEAVGNKTLTSYREKGLTPISEDPLVIAEGILHKLAEYMASGIVIPMIWEGPHAVKIVRKLVGSTEPLSSDVGTIRGDYVLDSYELASDENRSVYNLIHASTSVKEAKDEILHWFGN